MREVSIMAKLTWITTRGDCEKYHSGRPKRLMRAVLVSYVSEQRVLRMLPPAGLQEKSIYTHRGNEPDGTVLSSEMGRQSASTGSCQFRGNFIFNANRNIFK